MTQFVDDQRQLLADQLRKYQAQAQTQAPQGRMAGRVYVAPNPLEYLAAGLRGYGGMKGEQQTQQAMTDLQKRQQAARAEVLRGFTDAARGTPYNPGTQGLEEFGRASIPETQAQPGDMSKAFGILQNSEFPEYQQAGMQGIVSTAAEQQKRAQLLADKEREQQRISAIMNDPNLTPQQKIAMGIPKEAADPNFGRVKGAVVNGRIVDPYAVGTEVPQQARQPNLASDLLVPEPGTGRLVPNQALIDAKKGIAKAGASSLSVDARNYNTQESEQSKVYGKSLGEMRAAINQAGYDAPAKMARLDRMEQLLAGVDGGAAAPAMADIASFANSIGVKIDPKLGNKQAAEALAREMAATLRQPGTGPMTDKDFDNFLKQVPSLSKTAEGRTEIIKTLRGAIERDQRASQFAREYAKANKGVIDDNFFDSLAGFYAQNPVVTPAMPATNSRGLAFDPDKERRYQEWLKRQGGK